MQLEADALRDPWWTLTAPIELAATLELPGIAGISIPRNSRSQYASLPKVSSDNLQPGDLVFWGSDGSDPGSIEHVAIYLGGNQVIQAPQSGDVVKISRMWWGGYAGAVRPSA